MDDGWKDQHGLDWELPRSLAEIRERWASDALLRVLVGCALITAVGLAMVCYRFMRG